MPIRILTSSAVITHAALRVLTMSTTRFATIDTYQRFILSGTLKQTLIDLSLIRALVVVPLVDKDFVLGPFVRPAWLQCRLMMNNLWAYGITWLGVSSEISDTVNSWDSPRRLYEHICIILNATVFKCMSAIERERLAATGVGCDSDLGGCKAKNSSDGNHGVYLLWTCVGMLWRACCDACYKVMLLQFI